MEFALMIIKLVLGLIVVLGLMVIALKYGNNGLNKINNNKYIKIVDRVQLAKDTYIAVVKIGDKGVVLLTSSGHSEKLEELTKEELLEIESNRQESIENMTKMYDKYVNLLKEKGKKLGSKVRKNEEKN